MTDPIAVVALWLAGHTEWARHRPEAAEILADIDACARVVAGIARGPVDRKYLGPCGARVDVCSDAGGDRVSRVCDGSIYARSGALSGTCDACGATVDAAARRAWLDDTVGEHNFTATWIAEAYRDDGVKADTIRTWHARGRLTNHGHDQQGRPLFNVKEVLDAYRDMKVRQAEAEARRAGHRKVS